MPELSPTIWLILQSVLAAAGVAVWIALVLPSIAKLSEKRVLIDVWGPLSIVGPVLFAVGMGGESVAGEIGRQPVAVPIVVGMLGFGLAIFRVRSPGHSSSLGGIGLFPPVAWSIAAIVLLLLSAANVLTVLVGQCIFAAAAVVLWINTPPGHPDGSHGERDGRARRGESRAVIGMLLVALLAIGQGAALLAGGTGDTGAGHAARDACFIALGYAGVMLAITSIIASPIDATRLSGWSAMLGAIFGVGLLSLLHLLPTAMHSVHLNDDPINPLHILPSFEVAFGFATLAPEATGLLAIGLAGLAADRMGPLGRKTAGAILVFAACCLLLWKLL